MADAMPTTSQGGGGGGYCRRTTSGIHPWCVTVARWIW